MKADAFHDAPSLAGPRRAGKVARVAVVNEYDWLPDLYGHYLLERNSSRSRRGCEGRSTRSAEQRVRQGNRPMASQAERPVGAIAWPARPRFPRTAVIVALLLHTTAAHAHYVSRFTTIQNGAITFTGNTLGLSKATGQNQPGTSDAIGAFSTLNTALKVNNYPAGTTLNFSQNSASANLNLPPNSTVLYAELTWGGG